MKKISLWKKLGLGLGSACALPLALCATACTTTKDVDVRFISLEKFASSTKDNTFNKEYKTGNFDANTLLLGSKSFYDGNYFLFLGSNMFATTCAFFSACDTKHPIRDTKLWYGEDLKNSFWYLDAVENRYNEAKVQKDFGFVSFIDDFDYVINDEKGHKIDICKENAQRGRMSADNNIGPFDTWTKEIITQTKEYNKRWNNYEWDEESVEEGKFIREDAQAKSYRELCTQGSLMFPTVEEKRTKTFDTANDNKTSLMVVYKDGKLQEILDLPQKSYLNATQPAGGWNDYKETDILLGVINKYFLETEEEKK